MDQETSDSELLRVAYDDELCRKELRRQSGKEWPQLLAALKSGHEHPSAASAIEWIKQIVDECRNEITTMIAKQDFGEYPICIFGFDQLCSIWVPEFGTRGPFLSHDEAIKYAQSAWSEFLTSDEVTLHRFPASRSADKAAKARARRAVKKTLPVRYRLEHHEYSRVGVDKYLRHPRRQSEIGPPLSGNQLAESLVSKIGEISEQLRGQLQATGWSHVVSKVDRIAVQKRKKYEADNEKSYAAVTKAVVKFFDEFLDGQDKNDAILLDSAASAWVWRGFDLAEDHPDYEDRAGAIQRYARQRHYEALNAYRESKQKLSVKKRISSGDQL